MNIAASHPDGSGSPSDPTPPRRRTSLAIAMGWILLLGFVVAAAILGRITEHPRAFQIAYLVGFAGYFLIVAALLHGHEIAPTRWPVWLVGSVILRVIPIAAEPTDDAFRYVWEGRIQLAGFNPFSHAPTDPRLTSLRDGAWPLINHPDYPAIYPPLAQLQFAAVARVAPSVFAMKAVHVLWDVLAVAVLAAGLRRLGRPPGLAMLYALCPLVLTAFGIEGHLDSLMLLFVALVILADAAGRPMAAGAALGLAIGAKLTAGVLWPWLLIRHPRAAAVTLAVVLLTYVPYLDAGAGLFESLARFGGGRTFFDLLGTLGVHGSGTVAGRSIRVVGAAGIVLWLAVRRGDLASHGLAATGAVLLLMPVVHPWYLTWVLIFLPAGKSREGSGESAGQRLSGCTAWLFAAAAMACYYEANVVRVATGAWIMPEWAPRVVWGALGAGMLAELAAITWARRSSRRRESPS